MTVRRANFGCEPSGGAGTREAAGYPTRLRSETGYAEIRAWIGRRFNSAAVAPVNAGGRKGVAANALPTLVLFQRAGRSHGIRDAGAGPREGRVGA